MTLAAPPPHKKKWRRLDYVTMSVEPPSPLQIEIIDRHQNQDTHQPLADDVIFERLETEREWSTEEKFEPINQPIGACHFPFRELP